MGREVTYAVERAAELGGAGALAISCGLSAWLSRSFIPVAGLAPVIAAVLVGGLVGWLFVRNAGSTHAASALQPFELEAIPDGDVGDDEELLLDQPVFPAATTSRVVSLFGGGDVLPTAGELQRRIDLHLHSASAPQTAGPQAVPDASDALFEALADLRRSLRRG